MNNLLEATNAPNLSAIAQTNFERLDDSLAFTLKPTLINGDPNTLTGPPTAGTWTAGQLFVDQNLAIFRCTAAGTPGDWLQQCAAVLTAAPAGAIPENYLITMPAQKWAQFYWDGADWQPVFLQP